MIYEVWGFSRGTNQGVHEFVTAATDAELNRWLRDNNIFQTNVRPFEGKVSEKSRLTTSELIDFFSSLQFNGTYNISKALDGYAALCPNKRFRRVVREMGAMCRDRKTLSAAAARFPRYFPSWLRAFLAAGDESGTMAASIDQILGVLNAEEETDDEITEGLRTLRFILQLGLGLLALYVYVFLPTVKASLLAMHEPLTGFTAWVFNISDFFHSWLTIVGLIALWLASWLGFPLLMRNDRIRRRGEKAALALPIVKQILSADQTARVARMLGNIIPSGLPLPRAVQMAASTTTVLLFRETMTIAIQRASNHATLAGMFDGLNLFDYRFLLRIEASKNAPLRPTKTPDGKVVKSQCDACLESADFLTRLKKRLLRKFIHLVATWGTVTVVTVLFIASIGAFIPYFSMIKRLLIGF